MVERRIFPAMKPFVRVLRVIGILSACWIIWMIFAGYGDLRSQIGQNSGISDPQANEIWNAFFWATLPFAVLAVFVLLPYRWIPARMGWVIAGVLCCALLFLMGRAVAPFWGFRGIGVTMVPAIIWANLVAYAFLVASQVFALYWLKRDGEWNGAKKA